MKVKNKIWIISEFYYPVNTSTGYYITEIAEHLAKKRNNVNVICTNARYYKTDISATPPNEKRNNVTIHRVPTGNINKNNFFLRVIRLIISSLKIFFTILKSIKKDDEILVVTNPAFIILLMPLIKQIMNIKYSILVHDILPENLIAIGKLKKNTLFSSFLKKWFDSAYSKSDTCIAIGRDMKKIIEAKTKKSTNIELIPNWADNQEVIPIDKQHSTLIKKYNLKDQFVFQFAGNLGYAQGLNNILDAIKLVNNKEIHFLFIGSGAMESVIKDYAETCALANVTMTGFISRCEQKDFLNACDVAIVTLNDGMYGLGVPSKSYNIMAAGKPILIVADENSEISLCVKEHNIGWVAEPNNPKILANLFKSIYSDFMNNKINLSNPRIVAEKLFSKKKVLEMYDKLISTK